MSDPNILDAFERDRLELFAVKILMQCLLHIEVNQHPDPDQRARDIASLFERTVDNFALGGVDGEKEAVARDLMRQYGIEAIAQAVRAKPAQD